MNKVKKYINYLICKYNCMKKNTTLNTYNIGKNVNIGNYCNISKKVLLEKDITIGDYTYVSRNTDIYSNVKIGKFCSIAPNVQIGPGEHDTTNITTHPIIYNESWRKKLNIKEKEIFQKKIGKIDEETIIGNDVWIALNVFIKRGVTIGNGAVIGAGSIVTKDVEPYSIVVGNPAKIIKYRFNKDEIEFLEKDQWWNLSLKELEELLPKMYNITDYINWRKKNQNENGKVN